MQRDLPTAARTKNNFRSSMAEKRPTWNTIAGMAVVAVLVSGCQGSMMTTGFSSAAAPSTVNRTSLTERMYDACARETTPLFHRPSSPFVGKCECAAVSFLNYATEAQVDDLRSSWAMFGRSKAFVHKVLSLTDQFYTTHCGEARYNGNALALTALRGSKLSADGTAGSVNANGVELTTELNPDQNIQGVPLAAPAIPQSADGVVRFALSPSALADKDLVRYIQRKLKGLGYGPGPLDGIVGARTRKALESYRDAKGMPSDTPLEDVMSALLF